jgi:hypothetical protein
MLLGEALRVHPQELLAVLLDQPEERGLPRPTRPVHPRTDLHARPPAGGRDRRESFRFGEAVTAALFSGYFGDVTRPSSFFRVMKCSVSRNEGRGRRGRL